MRTVPRRHPALVLGSVFGAFAGGPALGAVVADQVAPGSELAAVLSPLAFVLTFATGIVLWFGLGVISVVAGALRRLVRGEWRRSPRPGPLPDVVPPGYRVFAPLGAFFAGLAGVVIGLAAGSGVLLASCGLHLLAGVAYGGALAALAHHGYLPFPEP